jgi:hypothetical protein
MSLLWHDPVVSRAHPDAGLRRMRFRRWVTATTIGELLGFAIPALAGAGSAAAGVRPAAATALLVAAGAGEGTVLGWAQSRALRRDLPALPARSWIAATAAGAVIAWLIGMTPSTFYDQLSQLPAPLLMTLAVPAGLLLLATIGTAQWLVLRRHVRRAGVWIAANALGWLAGLVVVFAVLAAAPSEALVAVYGVAGGLAMGATVALVTGPFMVRLLERPR